MDPHALADGEDEEHEYDQQQQQKQQRGMVRQSPGKALRSLQFGASTTAALEPQRQSPERGCSQRA
jgi:hypothetical protein